MNQVWVIEPMGDGSCRCYAVTTHGDGSFTVSKPFMHWTSFILSGEGLEDLEETALSENVWPTR